MTPVVIRPIITTLTVGSGGAQAFDDVQGNQGGATVQGRRHATHQRGRHAGGEQALQADRHQVIDQRRQHGVVVGGVGSGDVEQLKRAFLPEHVANHAGEDHEEDGRDLEKPGEQRAVLAGLEALRAEHALHVGLVGAPIPDAENRIAQQHAEPGELVQMSLGVDDGLQHVQLSGRHGLLERRHVMHPDSRQRAQSQHRHERRPAQQQTDLDVLRHHHRLQSAQRRVGDGEQREHDDRRDHRDAEKTLKHFRRGKQADADVDQQRPRQTNEREEGPRRRAIAPLHELRQRAHSRVDVERRKQQRQQDQGEAGHPLEVADDHPVLGAARREADEVNRGDVRREHRRADGEPTQRFVGQEIVVGRGVTAETNPDAERGDPDQVNRDDNDVEG